MLEGLSCIGRIVYDDWRIVCHVDWTAIVRFERTVEYMVNTCSSTSVLSIEVPVPVNSLRSLVQVASERSYVGYVPRLELSKQN